jgi:hypothetical protein
MLQNRLAIVTCVRESRQSINDLLDCCNSCECLSGSGKRLIWISSWDYTGLKLDMTLFGNCGSSNQSRSFHTRQDDLH